VTDTHRAWHTPLTKGRDLPSPIVATNTSHDQHGRHHELSTLCASGKELWKERVGAIIFLLAHRGRRTGVFQNDAA